MKRLVAIFLSLFMIVSCCVVYVSAGGTNIVSTTEYFDDGSYVVSEIVQSNSLVRTTKSGTKTSTYYLSTGVAVFAVKLTGTFSYTYGESAKATSASVIVTTYSDDAVYKSKFATYQNATCYGSGTVSYLGYTKTLTPQLTCDIYGNLS